LGLGGTRYVGSESKTKRGDDRACSTYGSQKRCIKGFGGKNLGYETTWKT
jgi:hypothetical protein